MITSLFGPLGAPGPLGLFAPDLNRLYQRHWGLEGSRKAKKWRRHTPDCSSELTSHSLSPLWVSREAKAAIQAPSPLWYKKIAQIQASTGPEINFLTKPRPIPAFPPMGLGVSTKKRGFCDNFFRVKIVWTPLTGHPRTRVFPGCLCCVLLSAGLLRRNSHVHVNHTGQATGANFFHISRVIHMKFTWC